MKDQEFILKERFPLIVDRDFQAELHNTWGLLIIVHSSQPKIVAYNKEIKHDRQLFLWSAITNAPN